MIGPKSRYANTKAFDPDPGADSGFMGRMPREIGRAEGVIEHRIVDGDRLDRLARHYFNDSRLWWRIVDANPEFLFGGDMVLTESAGEVILIPRAKES